MEMCLEIMKWLTIDNFDLWKLRLARDCVGQREGKVGTHCAPWSISVKAEALGFDTSCLQLLLEVIQF